MANSVDTETKPACIPEWLVTMLVTIKSHLEEHRTIAFGVFPSTAVTADATIDIFSSSHEIDEKTAREIINKANEFGVNIVLYGMSLDDLRGFLEKIFVELKDEFGLNEAEGFELDKLDPVNGGVVTLTLKSDAPEKTDS